MENRKINREAFNSHSSKMFPLKEAREYELDVIKQCMRSPSKDKIGSPTNPSKPIVSLNKYKIKRKSIDNINDAERVIQHDFNPKILGSPGSQVSIKIKYDRHLKFNTFKTFDRMFPFKSHSKNNACNVLPQNSALYMQRKNLFSTQVHRSRKTLREQSANDNDSLKIETFDPIQDIYHRKKSFYTSTYDRRVCDGRLKRIYKSYH